MIRLPRNAQLWMPGYLESRWHATQWRPHPEQPVRVWVSICDHYEPLRGNARDETARGRVGFWREQWPQIAARHRDSAGRPPRYSFFYPEEEYRPHLLEPLAEMTRAGIADVEIHIHHDRETEAEFVGRMTGFMETLTRQHGLLRQRSGHTVFGFIHGNWALDNSRPDGRWCGLSNEITLLRDMGCYADFTMPSGTSPTQARLVNRIYWATDDPHKPKSYDTGALVTPGGQATGDLLMIPGPFGLRWAERLVPRMEAGELAGYDAPTPYRVRRWLDLSPRVGNDIFVKLYSHGALERDGNMLLGGGLDNAFTWLLAECTRRGYQLLYATAWEMFLAVEAAAAHPEPNTYRYLPLEGTAAHSSR